jgi:ferredoxin
VSRSVAFYKVMEKLWPLGIAAKSVVRLPLIDKYIGTRLYNERNTDCTWIPVLEDIEVPPESVLPRQLLLELIDGASLCFVADRCLCRSTAGCSNFPAEIGCLVLGDGVRDINGWLGKTVSRDEAKEHVTLAINHGLLPLVLHASFDAFLFGIKEYRKMLVICFCCDCCCTVRVNMRGGPVSYRDRIQRLPGYYMVAGNDCSGCGKCERTCFLGAIKLGREGPEFSEFCKACGRCAVVCPRGNIRVECDPAVDTRGELLRHLEARTRID